MWLENGPDCEYIGEADFRKVITKWMWLENEPDCEYIGEADFGKVITKWMWRVNAPFNNCRSKAKLDTCHYKEIKILTTHNFNIFV